MQGKTIRFTPDAIRRIPVPASGQVVYSDSVVEGFRCRVSQGGTRTYAAAVRVKGKRGQRFVTIGRADRIDLATAREKAREIIANAELGVDVAADRAQAKAAGTFGDLATEYLNSRATPKSRRAHERSIGRDLLPKWKAIVVADIRRGDVRSLLRDVARRSGPIAANRLQSLISAMLNFAIDELEWIDSNVAARLQRQPEHSRDRVLSDAEAVRLWRALERESEPIVGALVRLQFLTGQRGAELRAMSWDAVDLETGWWTIAAAVTKNGMPHRVPLSATAVQILRDLRAQEREHADRVNDRYRRSGSRGGPTQHERHVSDKWVFASPGPWQRGANGQLEFRDRPIDAGMSNANDRIRKAAGLRDFRPHDLRRWCASVAARHGVPQDIIKRILNHKSGGARNDVTNVYVRYAFEPERRQALEQVEQHLLRLLAHGRCDHPRCATAANLKIVAA